VASHPVLGDDRYQPELSRHRLWTAKRLALHAALLGFEHPRTRERLRFESPVPVEFERFLAAAGRGAPAG
jgi:23S rRNA pseudouridine1911/1915/1917 synthase